MSALGGFIGEGVPIARLHPAQLEQSPSMFGNNLFHWPDFVYAKDQLRRQFLPSVDNATSICR
jgi:hypothetical protein